METRRLQFIIDAQDKASEAFKSVQDKLDGVQSKMKTAEDASKKFALGLAGVGVAAGGFAMKAIKAASEAEQMQISFTTMLGNAEKAQNFIAQMKEFAAKTPFETTDISKAAQTFLSFGMDVESVMPSVQMIGDVAMGNKERFAALSLAFAQVQSTGRLMGQDLLQMVNQGFNPLQIISEKTGKSMAELKDEMAKGAISAEDVAEAFRIATSEGGRFYGGMEAQSKTLAGVWSTLSDTFKQLLIDIGTKMIPVAKQAVDAINVLIEKTKVVFGWLQQNQWVMYLIVGAIVGALIPALISFATTLITVTIPAIISAATALAPFVIGGAIIGGVVAGIIWVVHNWEMISAKATEIFQRIANFLTGIWTSITTEIQAVWNNIASFFVAIWDNISQKFSDAGSAIQTIWSNTWNTIFNIVGPIWEKIKGAVGAGWSWITTKFTTATQPLANAWNTMWQAMGNVVTSAWEGVKNTIKNSLNWIINKINTVISAINKVTAAGASALGMKAPQIGKIPLLAEGGIVTKPTMAIIGESGPEAVVPLRQGAAGATMGNNITINITGNEFLGEEGIADRIFNQLMRQLKDAVVL